MLAKIIAMINQAEDKAPVISVFSQFCNKTVNEYQELAINFLGENFIEKIDILREMMQQAINTEFVPQVISCCYKILCTST